MLRRARRKTTARSVSPIGRRSRPYARPTHSPAAGPPARTAVLGAVHRRGERQSLEERLCHPDRLPGNPIRQRDRDRRDPGGRHFHPALFFAFGHGRRARRQIRQILAVATRQADRDRRGHARCAVLRARQRTLSTLRAVSLGRAGHVLRPGQIRDPAGAFETRRIARRQCVDRSWNSPRHPGRHHRRRAADPSARRRGRGGPSAALLALSLGGFGASLMIPATRRVTPRLHIRWNIGALIWEIIDQARRKRKVWLAVLGISWFWLVGAAMLSQFPNFAKIYLGAGNQVVTLFLTLNSIGIGLGSLLVSKILKGRISARLVPWSALGMAVFAVDLWWNGGGVHGPGPLMEMAEFLAYPAHWRILADLFGLALCGGIYVVPLYVIMQAESEETGRSRVVAANNIVNALLIVVAGGGSALMLKYGSGVPAIFLSVGLLNAALVAAILIKTRR